MTYPSQLPPSIKAIRDRAFLDDSLVAIDELAEGWAGAEARIAESMQERPDPKDIIQLKGELLARYQAMKHNLEIEASRIEDLIDRLDRFIDSM